MNSKRIFFALLVLGVSLAALITDPNDPRNFQGATVQTFATLLGITKQQVIDRQLLDDGAFNPEGAVVGELLHNGWSNIPGIGGCLGRSSGNSWDYDCNGANVFQQANQLDNLWFQSSGTIGDTVFDLKGDAKLAAVFVAIDHGPLPQESMESTIYVSNTPTGPWEQATYTRVFLQGHVPDNVGIWDGFVYVVGTASKASFRYVSLIHGGPAALLNDGDDEINAVMGLSLNYDPVKTEFDTCDENITFEGVTYSFKQYDVISFNDFVAGTGDTEGRIAVRRDLELGAGFSVGDKINTTDGDKFIPYGVLVGYDGSWESGRLMPDDLSNSGATENIFAGSSFSSPQVSGILDRWVSNCSTPGCLDQDFAQARICYTELSNGYCKLKNKNIESVEFKYSGLFIQCKEESGNDNVINLKASDFSKFTWISTENCLLGAQWIVNIDLDINDLVIQGDVFPAPSGKVTYNFCKARTTNSTDCDGTVTIKNALNGNVLAPNIGIVQEDGVILGRIVVCNFEGNNQVQVNRAQSSLPVLIQGVISDRSEKKMMKVADFSNLKEGDEIELSGQKLSVVSLSSDNGGKYLTVEPALASSVQAGTRFTASISGPFSNRYYATKTDSDSSSSSSLAFSAILILLVISLLF